MDYFFPIMIPDIPNKMNITDHQLISQKLITVKSVSKYRIPTINVTHPNHPGQYSPFIFHPPFLIGLIETLFLYKPLFFTC